MMLCDVICHWEVRVFTLGITVMSWTPYLGQACAIVMSWAPYLGQAGRHSDVKLGAWGISLGALIYIGQKSKHPKKQRSPNPTNPKIPKSNDPHPPQKKKQETNPRRMC